MEADSIKGKCGITRGRRECFVESGFVFQRLLGMAYEMAVSAFQRFFFFFVTSVPLIKMGQAIWCFASVLESLQLAELTHSYKASKYKQINNLLIKYVDPKKKKIY